MRLIDADALSESIKSGSGTELQKFFADVCVATAPTVEAVVLPCKIGDPVFIIGGKYRAGRFEQWINTGKFRLYDLEKMGKTVFLTREEAEAALAKIG